MNPREAARPPMTPSIVPNRLVLPGPGCRQAEWRIELRVACGRDLQCGGAAALSDHRAAADLREAGRPQQCTRAAIGRFQCGLDRARRPDHATGDDGRAVAQRDAADRIKYRYTCGVQSTLDQ